MAKPFHLLIRLEYTEPALYRLRGSYLILGRNKDCEIQIDLPAVSSQHCVFERNEHTGKFEIADYGSTNGTRINGSPVSSDPISLKDGDVVMLGETVEIFVIQAKEISVVERQAEAQRKQIPDAAPTGPAINPIAATIADQMSARETSI